MPKSETPTRDALIVKYLGEAYGKERQLETVLTAQIALAQRPQLKKGLRDHLKVTKAQAAGLKKRIRELGGKATDGPDLPGPAVVTDAAAAATSVANKALAAAKGPVQALRGTSPSDNELRNIRDCYWNEAEEIAHYNVIEQVATSLGDTQTAQLARRYRKEEERMQSFLERQVGPLVKAVIKDEVPTKERNGASKPRARRKPAASSSRLHAGSCDACKAAVHTACVVGSEARRHDEAPHDRPFLVAVCAAAVRMDRAAAARRFRPIWQ